MSAMPLSPAFAFDHYSHLKGIGGWLVFIAFSLAISPITVVPTILRTDIPHLLHPMNFGGAVVWTIYLLKNLLVIVVMLILNWLFYSERRVFPAAMIAYLIGMVALSVLQCFVNSAFLPGMVVVARFALVIHVLQAAVWIPYFLVSRRVKLTFNY